MKIAAVIVAAGRGTRAGGGLPKQWRSLAGQTSVAFAVSAFEKHPDVSQVVLVAHADDIASGLAKADRGISCVTGGATRSQSVQAGLMVLAPDTTHVLIHDGARPCVTPKVIDGVVAALGKSVAAAPAVAVVDALWTGEAEVVTGMVDRRGLYRAQTPQGFDLATIRAAHARFPHGADDDVSLVRKAGHKVAITPGSEDNIKITRPEDFDRAARILRTTDGYQTG
ncbi:MAG: 2-C-methyl-D-erythritol 4-phosphate cytidylyltransferase [Pseudomonadota bacterium]